MNHLLGLLIMSYVNQTRQIGRYFDVTEQDVRSVRSLIEHSFAYATIPFALHQGWIKVSSATGYVNVSENFSLVGKIFTFHTT